MPLPKFEDWRRPWVDGQLDEEKAARLVYNLKADVEKADEKAKSKDDAIAQLTADLDESKASKAGTDDEAQAELKDLRKKVRDLEKAGSEPNPAQQKEIDRLRVAVTLGLSEADSKRLVGETYEEFEADAKVFAKEHGIELPGSDEGGSDDGNEPPRARPVPANELSFGNRGGSIRATVDPAKLDLSAF